MREINFELLDAISACSKEEQESAVQSFVESKKQHVRDVNEVSQTFRIVSIVLSTDTLDSTCRTLLPFKFGITDQKPNVNAGQ